MERETEGGRGREEAERYTTQKIDLREELEQ